MSEPGEPRSKNNVYCIQIPRPCRVEQYHNLTECILLSDTDISKECIAYQVISAPFRPIDFAYCSISGTFRLRERDILQC